MLLLSMAAAAVSGLSMPLLFLLFGMFWTRLFPSRGQTFTSSYYSADGGYPGKLTEEFTGFFRQGADETEAVFTNTVNKYV